jgi:hypothetical protein
MADLFAIGLVVRSLKIALVVALIMITGCALGLPYGPKRGRIRLLSGDDIVGHSAYFVVCTMKVHSIP